MGIAIAGVTFIILLIKMSTEPDEKGKYVKLIKHLLIATILITLGLSIVNIPKFYFGSTAEIVDNQKTELTIGDAVDKDCQNRETVNVEGKVYVVTDTSMKLVANEEEGKFTKVLHSSSTTVSDSEKYTIANCSVLKPFSECQGTFKGFFAAADYYRDSDGLIFPADYTYNQYIEFKNMQGLKERLDNNLITNVKGND